MSKFKVGDKVEIVNPLNISKRYINTIHTVTNVDDTYVYLDIVDDNPYCVKYLDYELKLVEEPDLTGLHPITPDEMQRVLEKFGYVDETMDTSNRPVVDLSDRSDDSVDAFRYFVESGLKPLYIHGIKEEKEMNKVLELWYKRNNERICKKYKDLEDKYVKEHYEIVKQYNEMIENFENNLEEFCTKYSDITVNDDFVICKNADCNVYKYVIDESVIRNDAKITYKEDKNKEYKELQLKYEELNALLSMSDDLDYQQSILIEYGIIDKKTKRMINED